MKRLICLFIFIAAIMIILRPAHAAVMGDYCSAPPYVSRSVAPNIMILMDNSYDLLNYPAYGGAYSPSTTYTGYFLPGSCYAYSSNKFVEVAKSTKVGYADINACLAAPVANCYTSYAMTDTCPAAAPFRGNLLNWAATSRWDLLEKVLIGGKTASRQTNAHTLVMNGHNASVSYNNCTFNFNQNGSMIITESARGACYLLVSPAVPIAYWQIPIVKMKDLFARFSEGFDTMYSSFSIRAKELFVHAEEAWERAGLIAKAWAAPGIGISTGTLSGTVNVPYSLTLTCTGTGNDCPNGTYTWSFTGLPAWITSTTYSSQGNKTNINAIISGTPSAAGNYTFTAQLTLPGGGIVSASYTIVVSVAPLSISTLVLPSGQDGSGYSVTLQGSGGILPYTWGISGGTCSLGTCTGGGLPTWLSLDQSAGIISGTPNTGVLVNTTSSVAITLTDSNTPASTVSKTYSITISPGTGPRSVTYGLNVQLVTEPLTDLNGNDVWDSGETYIDLNGDGQWNGKRGIIQKFWDANNPRARWGLAMFSTPGATVNVNMGPCVPASPLSSFVTSIQNATPQNVTYIDQGLYGIINYYAFSAANFTSYSATGWSGCSNADPIDNVPCRKNFALIITADSGNFSGTAFPAGTAGCSQNTAPTATAIVQNACVGYNADLRSDKSGTQNVYTYIVNTKWGTTDATLQAAATAGGGKYYDTANPSSLESQLSVAITDILAQAASGTAVSVLTTSSRGVGSMVQAYFLPTMTQSISSIATNVLWTGYLQNLWIDPQDNLREDTVNDKKLVLTQDNVLKFYFDTAKNETWAGVYQTDSNGTITTSCTSPALKKFTDITYLWEAGKQLATVKNASDRKIFTSTNVLRTSGTSTITTSTTAFTDGTSSCGSGTPGTGGTGNCFNNSNVTGALALSNALNPDPTTYTASNIVNYVRGECLETAASPGSWTANTNGCGSATPNNIWRDRRVTRVGTASIGGDQINGNVWKLGDIISSTPKVLANTPLNTYQIDYGDSTYAQFYLSSAYQNKASVAFVGANDGMLHAFRVGYLDAQSSTFYNDSTKGGNTLLGNEEWAYIPFNAFPYLKYLADPAYCHVYFNDLSVRLVDVSLGDGTVGNSLPTDTKTQTSWHTVLIGGMRFGGACSGGAPLPPIAGGGYSAYFAIDVTDPLNPKPMWEFSDSDMGYSTTFPSIVRTGAANTNGNWYVVVGSGSTTLAKSGQDIDRTANGYIYFLNLKDGSLAKKINLGSSTVSMPTIVGDILAIDANKDYQSEKVYFGGARIESCTSPGTGCTRQATWSGGLYMIDVLQLMTIAGVYVEWGSGPNAVSGTTGFGDTIWTGSYPFTASPDAAKDDKGNVWVYAGSGKYYSDVDQTDTSQQIFMGIKDQSISPSYSPSKAVSSLTSLDNRTGSNVTGTVKTTATTCAYNSATGAFENQTYVTSITPTPPLPTASANGWYINLATTPASERVISRPLTVGGLVDFLTYRPTSDICSYGGDSYLYAVGYTTGSATANVAISSSAMTGGATSGTVTVTQGMKLGPGAPPTGEAIIIPPSKEGKELVTKKIQVATGVIVEATNQPVTSVASKIVHWLRK